MFRWYRDAARCYVYMTDVSKVEDDGKEEEQGKESWRASFRNSRWFTRGWTLQELIAPKVVEFYFKEGVFLGDKQPLESMIRDITRIPVNALRGTVLSEFTMAERESWIRSRRTWSTRCSAYSTSSCLSSTARDGTRHRGDCENKFTKQPRVRTFCSPGDLSRFKSYLTVSGAPNEDLSITFSLSEAPEVQHFVSREAELAEIRERLLSDGSRRVVVLHGLGGIGKTQLAVAYMRRYRDEYSAVFWLNIKDEHTIRQSFVKAAKQIRRQYPHSRLFTELGKGDDTGKAVEASTDDKSGAGVDIGEFLPTAYQGAIIITTRLSLIDIGHVIRVKKLESMADGLEILTSTSGCSNLDQVDPDATKLVEKLDGLPLALATAGAYLRREKVLGAEHPLLVSTLNGLASTYAAQRRFAEAEALYKRTLDIQKQHWGANDTRRLSTLGQMANLCTEQGKVEDAEQLLLHILGRFEAINGKGSESALWTRTTTAMRLQLAKLDYARGWLADAEAICHTEETGPLHHEQSQLREAGAAYRRSLAGWDKAYGPGHKDRLPLVLSLGQVCMEQGRLDEAEALLMGALRGYEEALTPTHFAQYRLVLNAAVDIGRLRRRQGRYSESRTHYRRAYDGYCASLGPDDVTARGLREDLRMLGRLTRETGSDRQRQWRQWRQ
ncbi:beta transducin-like protein HET-E4s [Cordyceps fumosorosea ARSEF 2679]|uniref:Beta transducin-like protein HET-E4s n=1 Tax=Cordyceps fumosorosea (strain ARSEF 2679) TaxID=1081104 RepID=A0A168D4Y7_CORFA|nr:beta transducin-like protein HET-E4s [Cordyceps fumosorosea ARSEF 2679]OAA72173.1 beta transducin-like protein HET-E4s [Cordyceps fumosorosea ARSEF 2679]